MVFFKELAGSPVRIIGRRQRPITTTRGPIISPMVPRTATSIRTSMGGSALFEDFNKIFALVKSKKNMRRFKNEKDYFDYFTFTNFNY